MITPADIDQIEAAKAVHAMRTGNISDFNATVDRAFSRPGGVERMIRILATHLANDEVHT